MQIRIALDVDDVLAAFTPHAHAFHKMPLEGRLNYWCERTMDARMGQNWFTHHIAPVIEFWQTLPLLSDPKDIDFRVACYMSSFPEDMFQYRADWLRKHGFPNAPLIVVTNKVDACQRLGITHLVDDKPSTIEALQGTGVTGIHFMAPYAGFEPVGGSVVTNLNQVNAILKTQYAPCNAPSQMSRTLGSY